MFQSMDATLLQWIAATPESWTVSVWFAVICAKFLIYFIPVHLVAMWLLGDEFDRRAALTVFCAVCVALLVNYGVGLAFYRDRPFVAGLGEALLSHKANASFPSNHATIFATYCAVLFSLRYRYAARLVLVLLILTCWARIYVRVHYPFDILFGLLWGGVCGYCVARWLPQRLPPFILHLPPLQWNEYFRVGRSRRKL